MLWLCLHLPRLAAEIFTRAGTAREPFAVVCGQGARQVVAAASEGAERAGISPGMASGAAHALAPGLFVLERDEAAEEAALARLAAWAGRFTPVVCLSPPREVSLEVEGSLKLFGGIDRIAGEAARGIRGLGYTARDAVAPTPLGAALLARARPGARVTRTEGLESALAPLPVEALDVSPDTLEALRGLGVRSIGDCRKLPRPGLARRVGDDLSRLLDRALGLRPDPREPFVPPRAFAGRVALPAEAIAAEPLLFAARRLLLELEGYLEAAGAGARGFRLDLFHREGRRTPVEVGLLSPARDPGRLLGLLAERLARTAIPGPVSAVGLSVEDVVPLAPGSRELWKSAARDPGEAWPELVERLKARLGGRAVGGVKTAAEHRPERAHAAAEPHGGGQTGVPARRPEPRPFWLLPRPAPLRRERVTLLAGPERIESGWWDGGDVRRDYFVAEDRDGARLWVFQDLCGARGWYLHGIFG